MREANINEKCLQGCSLLPVCQTLQERQQRLASTALNAEYDCSGPTAGQHKPICHLPEVVKQVLHSNLVAEGLVGGPVQPLQLVVGSEVEVTIQKIV